MDTGKHRKTMSRYPRGTPSDKRSRDWSDAAASQGTRTTGHLQKVGRGKEGSYLEFQREHGPAKL